MATQSIDVSTLVERPTRYNTTKYNMVKILLPSVAHAAGSGAGATVTIDFAFGTGTIYPAYLPVDTTYKVNATASQACFITIINKTVNGFSLLLTPKDSSTTLASGTVDGLVHYENGGN